MNADKLAKALDELPAAYDLLPLFMLPGSRPDMGSLQHHSTDNTRAPLVLAVVDLLDRRHKADAEPTREDYELDRLAGNRRQGVLPTLSQWVRLVDGELWDSGLEHTPPADMPSVDTESAWLLGHVAWISQQQWANEITDDITGMLHDILEIVGEDDKLKGKLFCTNCRWPVEKVLVVNKTTGKEDHYYRCTGCDNRWSRLEAYRIGKRKEPKPLVECARLADVSEKTLRRLKERGFLKVKQREGKTELFDLDEVMKLTMNLRYRQGAAA